jgi:N-acetylmuramic acid 6-phosphate etherase
MPTEDVSRRHLDLDSWSVPDMLAVMYEGQLAAVAAVGPALAAIAEAVEDAAPALQRGGRLVYVGAGTSGRIAVQDGVELTPTFGWPPERVVFVMAGGPQAFLRSVEGAEDDEAAGVRTIAEAQVGRDDVVIAVAASGATRFTIAALRAAAVGVTIAVANNAAAPLFEAARHRILVETGAEAVAGSTRMKAGTAQKAVLNLLSTAVMVRLGRVYRGLMVDMRAGNAKLRRRAAAIVASLLDGSEAEAAQWLDRADGDLKTAVLLGLGIGGEEAARLLQRHDGRLRAAIEEAGRQRG